MANRKKLILRVVVDVLSLIMGICWFPVTVMADVRLILGRG